MEDKFSEINYEAAREEYLERLIKNPGVDSVIEFGQINAPGLSDIDWLVILDTNKILNSKFLLLDDVVSMNTKNAFQHRPIFYPKIFLEHIHEFILPTRYDVKFGKTIDLINDTTINPYFRNISVAFEFFKRHKNWLRKPIFDQLTFKKKLALFISIANHKDNSIFLSINDLQQYSKIIDEFRNDYYKKGISNESFISIRQISIRVLSLIEKKIDEEVCSLINYHKSLFKYDYPDVSWSDKIIFNENKNHLVKSLKLFPSFYKSTNDVNTELNNYLSLKYDLIKENRDLFLKFGLKDGLIADLGFNDWFPRSFREYLYKVKMKIKNLYY